MTTDLVFNPASDVGWSFQPTIKDGAMFAGDWQDADQVTAFVEYLDQQQAQGFRLELSQDLGDWQFLAAGPVLYAGVALCHELQHTVQPLHLRN